MTIKVSAPTQTEALVYENVFMESMKILQIKSEVDNLPPKYSLKIDYRMYAVDSSGVRHFENKRCCIDIQDYYTLAATKAAAGDLDLVNAMGAIEVALGKIIEDQGNYGTVTISL